MRECGDVRGGSSGRHNCWLGPEEDMTNRWFVNVMRDSLVVSSGRCTVYVSCVGFLVCVLVQSSNLATPCFVCIRSQWWYIV